MTKLKNFIGTKNGKIAIGAIAIVVIVAIIGTAITLKHKSKSNLEQTAKTEDTLDVKKAEEAVEKASEEEKKAEAELEKAEKSGNKDEIEKARVKVDEAKKHTLKAKSEANRAISIAKNPSSKTEPKKTEKKENTEKPKKSENTSSNKPSKSNKPNKPNKSSKPSKPNKPSKPSKPSKANKPSEPKETLAEEIAELKAWVRDSHPNAIFMNKQFDEDYDYEDDIIAFAESKGIHGFRYSEIKLSNGKYMPYLWQ